MMDDEKLILLVREKNEIYNKFNPHYRIIDKKREAWTEIANEMEIPEEEAVRRWSGLRDRFTRESKKMEQANDGSPCLWPFYEMMTFLRPFITPRPLRRGLCFKTTSSLKKRPTSPSPTVSNKETSLKYSPQPSPQPSLHPSPRASPVNCPEFTQVFDDPLVDQSFLRRKAKNPNAEVDKCFIEAVETLKKACAANAARHANPAVHAFGEMIVSTICSMNSRNQIKTMQQVTDLVMRNRLEEDELLQVSYSTH